MALYASAFGVDNGTSQLAAQRYWGVSSDQTAVSQHNPQLVGDLNSAASKLAAYWAMVDAPTRTLATADWAMATEATAQRSERASGRTAIRSRQRGP